jgi:hypothetical protein
MSTKTQFFLRSACRFAALLALVMGGAQPVLAQTVAGTSTDTLSTHSQDGLPQSMRDATRELDRLSDAAERDGNLRTRAMLAWRNPLPSYPEGSRLLVELSHSALPSDDPVVAMLFATGCDAPDIGCDALAFATHWTQLDADNAAAWLTLWNIQSRMGDTAAAEAALSQALAAPHWRDYTVELTRVYVAVVPDDAEILERMVVRLQAPPRVVGIVNALYRTALVLCRLPSKHDACVGITDVLSREPVSLLQATVSASLSQHFGVAENITRDRRERVEGWQWAVAQGQPGGLVSSDPRANAGEVIAYIDRLDAFGEVAAAEETLRQKHMTQAEAAARYRADRDAARDAARNSNTQTQSGAGLRVPGQ